MFRYMDKIKQLLDPAEKGEKKSIKEAIDILTQTNLQRRSVYIFGASHTGILAEEIYYRAGGMIAINTIFGRGMMLDRPPITFTSQIERLEGYGMNLAKIVSFKSQDVLILHSILGRNPIIIDLALAAKAKGIEIISLTNVQYSRSVTSRHSSGKRLFEVFDVVIDSHRDIGDACCELTSIIQKTGPSSTVIGTAILNTIIVKVCERLIANEIKHPLTSYSANLDGGDLRNVELYEEYKEVIYYEFI